MCDNGQSAVREQKSGNSWGVWKETAVMSMNQWLQGVAQAYTQGDSSTLARHLAPYSDTFADLRLSLKASFPSSDLHRALQGG